MTNFTLKTYNYTWINSYNLKIYLYITILPWNHKMGVEVKQKIKFNASGQIEDCLYY